MLDALRKAALGLFTWCAIAATAHAACVGQSLVDKYRAEDPAGIEAVFALSHSVPNSTGRAWEVSRPGTPSSLLFGTFHAQEAVETVPEPVWSRLLGARIAVFEVDLEQQDAMEARMSSDPDFVFDTNRPGLSTLIGADDYAALAEALEIRGLAPEAAEYMRPWLLTSMLGFPACHLRAMAAGAEALDTVMAKRAEAAGIPVAGLETYEDAIAAFQRIDQTLLIKAIGSAGQMADVEEDLFRTNTALYAQGETVAINEFAIWLSDRLDPETDARALNRSVMAEILDARNIAWMDTLEGFLSEGNAFIGVGALHLPGEKGLIELLRSRGYSVRRAF